LSAINVSGNPYFDVAYYGQQVADWANRTGAYGKAGWTADSVTAHIFNEQRMSLWEHFREVGLEQRLNPSASFDTGAYLAARAAAMNKATGTDAHTVESAIAAIRARGENPIMDFYNFGRDHGIEITACSGKSCV
ncbi:MAG: hypothetical protein HDQ91_02835, partial [Desulfovibrio sp.]|nr:hypothetical protein [Desulfovibrio sp.]